MEAGKPGRGGSPSREMERCSATGEGLPARPSPPLPRREMDRVLFTRGRTTHRGNRSRSLQETVLYESWPFSNDVSDRPSSMMHIRRLSSLALDRGINLRVSSIVCMLVVMLFSGRMRCAPRCRAQYLLMRSIARHGAIALAPPAAAWQITEPMRRQSPSDGITGRQLQTASSPHAAWKLCDDTCDHGCDDSCNTSCDCSCDDNCDDSCTLGVSCDSGCNCTAPLTLEPSQPRLLVSCARMILSSDRTSPRL